MPGVYRRKETKYLWIWYLWLDTKHMESAKTTDPDEAQQLLNLRLREIEEGTFVPPSFVSRRRHADSTQKWAESCKRRMLIGARKRAKERGVSFALTLSSFEIPTFCPYLGLRLEPRKIEKHDASPSLDRIIPELGYVEGNVQVISVRANMIKSNATARELRLVATASAKAEYEARAFFAKKNQCT